MELRDKKGLTEAEFLEAYAKKQYQKPSLTADIALLSEDLSQVLLVRRAGHPFLGCWALPGGFANPNEPLEDTAARELREETGAENLPMRLVGVFSRPQRDPRGWVVSAAYTARVSREKPHIRAGDDAGDAAWFPVVSLPKLAFDHDEILRSALAVWQV